MLKMIQVSFNRWYKNCLASTNCAAYIHYCLTNNVIIILRATSIASRPRGLELVIFLAFLFFFFYFYFLFAHFVSRFAILHFSIFPIPFFSMGALLLRANKCYLIVVFHVLLQPICFFPKPLNIF